MKNNTNIYTQYTGFLLIELLVAIMIISSLSLILAQFQGNARTIHASAHERVQAIHKATSFIEEVIGSGLAISKTGKKEQSDSEEFMLSWKTYPPKPVNGLPISDVYQYIAVSVSWNDSADKERSLQLVTGVVRQ